MLSRKIWAPSLLIFICCPVVWGQVVSHESQLVDTTVKAQVFTSQKVTAQIYSQQEGQTLNQICNLKPGSKGSVVATAGQRQLVIFDQKDWKSSCKGISSKSGLPLAWVDEGELRPMGLSEDACSKMSCRLEDYGDRCAAVEYLESEIEKQPRQIVPDCQKDCEANAPQKSAEAVMEMLKQAVELTNFRMNNRCLVEGDKIDHQVKCDFEVMLNEARSCPTPKKSNGVCSPEICRARLNKMACENSPWRGFDLDQRLHLMLESATKYAKPYGIDPRTIPCLAGVETGTFEPMYKNLMACQDPAQNSYHGLGMLTKSTLKDFLNPLREFRSIKRNAKGQTEEVAASKFRSQNPLFQRMSYYACPEKLHSMMAASPDLQIELMAYTLQQKQVAAKGDERLAVAYYNGLATLDGNQRPHMDNYASAVMACTQCLRENQPLEGEIRRSGAKRNFTVKSPAQCLSITMRANSPSGFHMSADRKAFDDFEVFGKYCEGGR